MNPSGLCRVSNVNNSFTFAPVKVYPIAKGSKPYSIHTEQNFGNITIPLAGKAAATNFYTPQSETWSIPFVNTYIMQYDVSADAAESTTTIHVIQSRVFPFQPNVGKKRIPMIHIYHD